MAGKIVMKLFVWDKFAPDYSPGLAFAVAPDIETAQKTVIEEMGYNPSEWGDVKEINMTEPMAFAREGGG